ncbi:uncharacterized protein LOC124360615 isoform X1 [Homalodisca vitripennis]|uniref:uncharacterized protein LOC124360615 isoform X1 n=1 Tax=Homalodisca vitripennis TaxID=197043 RepID=UPI001EEA134E|nr:uncharacterized protein LOC124360615 isoform X1 [Homalodisca vitripennis]
MLLSKVSLTPSVSNKKHVSPNFKSEVDVSPNLNTSEEEEELLGQDVRKHWEIGPLLFAAPYHDIDFTSPACQFYYLQYACNGLPDRQLVGPVRQAYYQVLARLNHSELQVKNFILPVQLMKLKYIDPYSRQRIIENICRYLSLQTCLRSVVLEEAEITFADLCRFLLALNVNSHIRKLYLWGVLKKCETPFTGPLQSDTDLDNLPRIPYTYNPGGRKYLKKLAALKYEEMLIDKVSLKDFHRTIKDSWRITNVLRAWMGNLLNACVNNSNQMLDPKLSTIENYNKLLRTLNELPDSRKHVFFQKEVGIQCCISQVSISTYDYLKLFITKSMPLKSLHIDNGFCPTLDMPQLMFFSVLKFLYLNFKETLEEVSFLLWHSSGRIDSELEKFIKEAPHLSHFEYYGPLQYKSTISKLCDAALLSSSEIKYFKLMVQGDPCYSHIARDLTAELYQKYKPNFKERSIQFFLGTHNS